jgi:hypothetical protein
MARDTLMKVKLFFLWMKAADDEKDARSLEDKINAWLNQNPHIKVIDIKQSSNGLTYAGSRCLVSVWYEEGGA